MAGSHQGKSKRDSSPFNRLPLKHQQLEIDFGPGSYQQISNSSVPLKQENWQIFVSAPGSHQRPGPGLRRCRQRRRLRRRICSHRSRLRLRSSARLNSKRGLVSWLELGPLPKKRLDLCSWLVENMVETKGTPKMKKIKEKGGANSAQVGWLNSESLALMQATPGMLTARFKRTKMPANSAHHARGVPTRVCVC